MPVFRTKEYGVAEELLTVGKSAPRLDATKKVTGEAVYTTDVRLPGMLYGKIKRSPYPHAKIKSVDSSRAKALQEVRTVVAGKDLPPLLYGSAFRDQPVLARGVVRYVGEPVVALAAESEEAAEEALDLIEIDYEELPAVFDPEEALKPDPPVVVHPEMSKYEGFGIGEKLQSKTDIARPNVCFYQRVRKGDVERAFKDADLVVENRFTSAAAQHVPLEPSVSVAKVEDDGSVTLWASTQAPYRIRPYISQALGIPASKIRVIVPYVGGGYGQKLMIYTEPICVALAQKTGKPVKLALTREENFTTTTVKHPFVIYIKDGVRRDGAITAREMRVILNGGAYLGGDGVFVTRQVFLGAVGAYRIPNLKLDSYRVYTNQVVGGAFRGFGVTQTQWAIESQMDIIADRLKMDSAELRLRNLLQDGDRNGVGELVNWSAPLNECLKKAVDVIEWGNRLEESKGPWRRGRGIAVGLKHSHGCYLYGARAVVKLHEDASVELLTSAPEIGTGTHTVLAQMVAEEFKIPLDKVRVSTVDTALTPFDEGAYSSRQTYTTGNAVIAACRDLKRKVFEVASEKLDAKPEDLEVRDGEVLVKESPARKIRVQDLCAFAEYGLFSEAGEEFVGEGRFFKDVGFLDLETGQCTADNAVSYYSPVAEAAEVDVDIETGRVKLDRLRGKHRKGD